MARYQRPPAQLGFSETCTGRNSVHLPYPTAKRLGFPTRKKSLTSETFAFKLARSRGCNARFPAVSKSAPA